MSEATARIRANAALLDGHLALWAGRDDTRAQPEIRAAANDAVDAIDAMLVDLYACRNRLLGEIRESDDASAVRVDALLARLGAEKASKP